MRIFDGVARGVPLPQFICVIVVYGNDINNIGLLVMTYN